MTPLEQKLKNLREIRLPSEIRIGMREELISYADLHAAQAGVLSPISHTFRFSMMFRVYAGLAAMVLVVTSIGGTAYAAEAALPGDALYTIKTKVSEPIQTALIPSTKGKAAWHAILAERRLDEASKLAADEKLSPGVQSELAANFNLQVKASVASADLLESSGDAVGSLDARSDLEARLTAHEQILAMMSSHLATATSSEGTDTNTALKNLLALVEGHKVSVEESRVALENALVPFSAKRMGSDDARASTSVHLSFAKESAEQPRPAASASAVRIATADAARTEEVQTILANHAALFAKFMPAASTTATTTATSTMATSTTATSTVEVKVEGK